MGHSKPLKYNTAQVSESSTYGIRVSQASHKSPPFRQVQVTAEPWSVPKDGQNHQRCGSLGAAGTTAERPLMQAVAGVAGCGST